jgi:hypothetical protein
MATVGTRRRISSLLFSFFLLDSGADGNRPRPISRIESYLKDGACAGLLGASEMSETRWIEVKALQNPANLYSAQRKHGLGPGEMSIILLA